MLIELYKMLNKKHSNDLLRIPVIDLIRIEVQRQLLRIPISILQVPIIVFLNALSVLFEVQKSAHHQQHHRNSQLIIKNRLSFPEAFLSMMKLFVIVLLRIVPYVERIINDLVHMRLFQEITSIEII